MNTPAESPLRTHAVSLHHRARGLEPAFDVDKPRYGDPIRSRPGGAAYVQAVRLKGCLRTHRSGSNAWTQSPLGRALGAVVVTLVGREKQGAYSTHDVTVHENAALKRAALALADHDFDTHDPANNLARLQPLIFGERARASNLGWLSDGESP